MDVEAIRIVYQVIFALAGLIFAIVIVRLTPNILHWIFRLDPRKPRKWPRAPKKEPQILWIIFWGSVVIILTYPLFEFLLGNYGIDSSSSEPIIIDVEAHPRLSGSASAETKTFKNFENHYARVAIGDVAVVVGEEVKDYPSVAFLTFYISEIPEDAKIENISLEIPCSIRGTPNHFKDLRIKAFPYGEYKSRYFDRYVIDASVTNSYFDRGWYEIDGVINLCKEKELFIILYSGDLKNALMASIPNSYFQLMMWFNREPSLENEQTDAIILQAPPILHVEYLID